MPIDTKIIDSEIIEDEDIQINYDSGEFIGLGDIGNLYTIFRDSILNVNSLNDYPGLIHGNGDISFNYLGIRDIGYNGNTYAHDWSVFIVDTAVDPDIEDCVPRSDNSHGYSYDGGGGGNSSTFNCLNTYQSGRRIWRLTGQSNSSITGTWSPCSSGLSNSNGGLVGWTNNKYRSNNCSLENSNYWDIHPTDSSTSMTWELPNFPNVNQSSRNWYETVSDKIQNDLSLFSSDLYSICIDLNNDGILDTCTGGQSDGNSCTSNDDCNEGSYYICVYMQSHDAEWINESRDKTITVYKLPKKHILDLWMKSDGSTDTITWESGGTYSRPTYVHDESGDRSAAFSGGNLSITITSPVVHFPPAFNESWVYIEDDSDYVDVLPTNYIDYIGLTDVNGGRYTPDSIFDFRPISNVSISYLDNEVDLQTWYDIGSTESFIASAPNTVNLSFKIAENSNLPSINYYSYNSSTDEWVDGDGVSIGNIGFKFFVIDWDSDNISISNSSDYWNEIISEFPQNYSELFTNQTLYDTFKYSNVIDISSGGYNVLTHQYNSPGIKIIKAVIFSYLNGHIDGYFNEYPFTDYIQGLRWKVVSIKVYMGMSSISVEDFADIGGSDYTYIPWPNTTPIIGGVSSESNYTNSVYDIYNANKFNDNELFDYYRTTNAFNNLSGNSIDELGDSPGDIDVGQVRLFSNSMDMNFLLGMSELDIIDGDEFNPYNNYDFWVGDPCVHYNTCSEASYPTYPVNSSVGLIFINDNESQDLINDCLFEFNLWDIDENDTIDDSSGHDYRGIVMGDYSVKKQDYGKKIIRDESMELPEQDNSEGAF